MELEIRIKSLESRPRGVPMSWTMMLGFGCSNFEAKRTKLAILWSIQSFGGARGGELCPESPVLPGPPWLEAGWKARSWGCYSITNRKSIAREPSADLGTPPTAADRRRLPPTAAARAQPQPTGPGRTQPHPTAPASAAAARCLRQGDVQGSAPAGHRSAIE